MKAKKKPTIQNAYMASLDDMSVASFDMQTDSAPTKPLIHKNSRFLYILSGKAKIKIQDKVHDLRPGVLIALLPWQISEIIEVSEPVSYYLLIFNFDFVNQVLKRDLNINDENINIIDELYSNDSVCVPPSKMTEVKRLFEDIRDEVGIRSIDIDMEPRKYSSIYVLSLLTELIIMYLRMIEDSESCTSNAPLVTEELFKYMYLNSANNLNLSKLSGIFLMSESSISKYIAEMTGLGFYELLNEMRLSKAQFLLLHTNLTLDEIAQLLHFSDPAQLSKVFSTNYGITTKRFKTANKGIDSLVNVRLDKRNIKIINYIYDNYEEDIDIMDVSKLFDISPRTVNEILKYFVEQNFSHFLNTVRINKACELLLRTSFPITEIAMMVGFNSQRTFSRNFITTIGMTPSEYRASILEQTE